MKINFRNDLEFENTFQLCFPDEDEIIWYRCNRYKKYNCYLLMPSLKVIKLTKEHFHPITGYSWYQLDKLIESCKNEDEFLDKLMIDEL